MLILGFNRGQILKMNLYEMIMIFTLGFIFGSLAGIYFNASYSLALDLELIFVKNWMSFWISVSLSASVIIINYAIPLLNLTMYSK